MLQMSVCGHQLSISDDGAKHMGKKEKNFLENERTNGDRYASEKQQKAFPVDF